MRLKIGIDFDNTLACYDDVFYRIACEKNLIPADFSNCKTHIRDYLRSQKQEEAWTTLQGTVYGPGMGLAQPFSGVEKFFTACFSLDITPVIISHRTRHPYLGPRYDLHEAARQWLNSYPFFKDCEAFFETTLQAKLERIQKEHCDVFIDDLPELLQEPSFPSTVKRVLFDPKSLYPCNPTWLTLTSWHQMPSILKS